MSIFRGTKKPNKEKRATDQSDQSVSDIMQAYGKLLATHPQSIMDISLLPLPKAKMKILYKALYGREADPKQRAMLEMGFMFLSNFQDGFGPIPIDGQLLKGDPRATLDANRAILAKWVPWNNLMVAEGEILLSEWTEFKQGAPI